MYLPDGVVVEKNFVERLESMAQHSQEVLDEDDAFLGRAGTEVWEYEIVNDRASEFEDALKNSNGHGVRGHRCRDDGTGRSGERCSS